MKFIINGTSITTRTDRENNMINQTLDATGLNCPLPILRANTVLKTMDVGQVLKVISTDRGSINDIPTFCRQTGNELIESIKQDINYVFLIKKLNL